jgi:hypothetical protein
MNKMVGGKQCTVLWHIDDLKISHLDAYVVNNLIDQIINKDGNYGHEGKVHDYLSMTIDYHENGKVKISMFDYICKMLDELPKDMSGTEGKPSVQD